LHAETEALLIGMVVNGRKSRQAGSETRRVMMTDGNPVSGALEKLLGPPLA
jgi:hypothetical protein